VGGHGQFSDRFIWSRVRDLWRYSSSVCTKIRQLASDDEALLSRVITGDLAPCNFFLFPKIKLKPKGRRFDTTEEIQAESQRVLD
jgi:hypothetical protein